MRGARIFLPITSTAPAFNSTLGSTQTAYALESTAIGRIWQGPGNRSVRLVNDDVVPFHVQFGGSTVAASTDSFRIPGGWPHVFYVPAGLTHVSFVSNADVIVNVALGYGGRTEDGRVGTTASATSTSTGAAPTVFTVSQAGSITWVPWMESSAAFSPGDAAHILWTYDYTSTST